jgi:hypothetical protein
MELTQVQMFIGRSVFKVAKQEFSINLGRG